MGRVVARDGDDQAVVENYGAHARVVDLVKPLPGLVPVPGRYTDDLADMAGRYTDDLTHMPRRYPGTRAMPAPAGIGHRLAGSKA